MKALGHVAFRSSVFALDAARSAVLDAHLQTHLYQTAKAVACWVKDTFEADNTESGMTALPHRLGDVDKTPEIVPGKADPEARSALLEQSEKLEQDKDQKDPIDFMDATHPQHNPVIACEWIKRGEEHAARTGPGGSGSTTTAPSLSGASSRWCASTRPSTPTPRLRCSSRSSGSIASPPGAT